MYTNNPNMPKIRRDAVLFAKKHGVRCAARHYGFSPGAISNWMKKSKKIGLHPIPTKSSRPKSHPNELDQKIIDRIVELRHERKRTYEVIHKQLEHEGIKVSPISVYNTLKRKGLLKKRSPWKRTTPHIPRPGIEQPGDLVQIDTIHLMTGEKTRIYVMTLIDVYSRNVYAKCYETINSKTSVNFLNEAEHHAVFDFKMIQTDHGPEFGKWFRERIKRNHRYSRIGKPNDNSHIERFNRTIQEEFLNQTKKDVVLIKSKLDEYLKYYNEERLHMGIDMKTPLQIIKECSQGA
mgnify:CR=1 FL=1